MIDLIYHSESVFVYNAEDWETLRKEYRIVGEFLGIIYQRPALPLQLLPEEALLLIDKQIARLVSCQETIQTQEELQAFKTKLLEEETVQYREIRLKQLQQYIDRIVAGKQKKGDTRTKEEILDGELDKLVINEKNMIWPLFTEKFNKETATVVPTEVLLKQTTPVKYETYKSLWEQNYYITSGLKFGGDFVVYDGDPILYHSSYIVRCMHENEKLYPTEIVTLGRIGTAVKKKGLLSSLQNGIVNYITINWIDQ